ncbi:MAG: PAS domain S-box protein, partial [Desulfobacula sp.]|nr:PAS domain S-box protein [Desulfobacula sp.]
IDDGYYEVDLEGNFLFFNETLLTLLGGYSRSEFCSMNYKQLVDKNTAKKVFQTFSRVYDTGRPERDLGYELINKDGETLYGETSVSLIYDSDGKVTGFRGVVRDRTERKALEDELVKHRDSLEKMIVMRTRELEEETIQKNYVKKINASIFNISIAVNTTQSLDELYPVIHNYLNDIIEMPNFYIGIYDKEKDMIKVPYNVDQYDGTITEIRDISKIPSLTSEVVLNRKSLLLRKQDLIDRSKDKRILGHVPENWLGVPLVSQDKTIGIMAIQSYTGQDHFSNKDLELLVSVSNQVALAIERRQALDDLHEREEKYRKLIETTSAGYWQVDKNNRTIEVNHALCDMIGYEEHEIMGKTPFAFFEDQSKKEYGKIFENSAQTSDWSYEITFVKKNKQLLYSKVDATSIFDEDGNFKGLFAFITDITKRIKSQQDLMNETLRANKMAMAAQAASKAKSEFLANMSH